MQKKNFLPEFPVKFGIFVVILKTIIRFKWKPQNSESEFRKPKMLLNLPKRKNNFFRYFPVNSVFRSYPEKHNPDQAETAKLGISDIENQY